MKMPPLPELPEPDVMYEAARDDCSERYAHSSDEMRAYALAYGEAVREAVFQQIYERAKSKGWGMRNDDPFEESVAEIWRELERESSQ